MPRQFHFRSGYVRFHLPWLLVLSALSGLSEAAMPAPDQKAAKFEIAFMTDMVAHHQMAVMMSEMCLARTDHGELRAMCEQIIATQSAEVAMLTTWLGSWYGITPEPPQMTRKEQKDMAMLETLDGAAFEIEFMKSMIRHHFSAIIHSAQCLRRAYHVELVTACQGMITTQAAEIRQLQTWLCDWYGICNHSPRRPEIVDPERHGWLDQ